MPGVHDYLLSYGNAGDFGRFHSTKPLSLRRGTRAVIRTPRGMELGTVLCPTMPSHTSQLPNTSVGQLLRSANDEDERNVQDMVERAQNIFCSARGLAADLSLPIELLDVEVLLDGQRAILYHLRWSQCDLRQFVSKLSKLHDLYIELQDLSRVEEKGCGKPDCGRGAGGCTTCGSGGCGTCGSHGAPELQAYFAGLREQTIARKLTPLL